MSTNNNFPTENATSYDELPYQSYPFPQTYPSSVGAIGKLFGMSPTKIDRANVLELGCANGSNLIPLALNYPNAKFIGVDLSKVQIEQAKSYAQDLGIKNIDFRHASITDVDESYGKFDYIISHGVFSWVPEHVRSKMLEISQQLLSDQGLAYISYNVLPGWNSVKSVRDMMIYHSSYFPTMADKFAQAGAFIGFINEILQDTNNAHAHAIRNEINLLQNKPMNYVVHEHLSEENQAYYFHEFMKKASAQGLQYVADAHLSTMYLGNMPPKAVEKLKEINDIIRMEQYMDFITNRRFRSTILCKNNIQLNRNLTQKDLHDLFFSMNITTDQPEAETINNDNLDAKFYISGKKDFSISTFSAAMKAILYTFAQSNNKFIDLSTIVKIAHSKLHSTAKEQIKNEFLANALQMIFSGQLSISLEGNKAANRVSEKPQVTLLARYQTEKMPQMWVTNTNGHPIAVNIFAKYAFRYMDGKRNKEQIVEELLNNHISNNDLVLEKNGKKLEDKQDLHASLAEALGNTINYAQENHLLAQ